MTENRQVFAVNLETDKHIVCVNILDDVELDQSISKTLVYMSNYVKDFITRNNGPEHFKTAKIICYNDLKSLDLKDGYYYVKDLDVNKYIVYNIDTTIIPGYIYNGADRTINKVFELYANRVGDCQLGDGKKVELLRLNKEVNYADVINELQDRLLK